MRSPPEAALDDFSKLLLPDGATRPYRPCPADFRERFLEMGWSKELQEHYRTNWRVIRRWIEEAGGDQLRAERRSISGGTARPTLRSESRAARYVKGKTLSAVRKRRSKR
jgi:hypothetical protein